MDGKYMVNERYSFKLSNYARDLLYSDKNGFGLSSFFIDLNSLKFINNRYCNQ